MESLPDDLSERGFTDYLFRHTDYVYPYAKYDFPNSHLAFFQYGESLHVAYRNKKNRITYVMKNKSHAKPQLMIPNMVDQEHLYYLCEPGYLSYVIDTTLMSDEDVKRMESTDEFDNPILIIYKLKE